MRISDWSSDVCSSDLLEAPSPDHALEQCWELYQNIDSNYHTPDNLRSLMTSDMVKLIAEDGTETWWICCSSGWHQTEAPQGRSEEHTSELQSLMRISYAVFCLTKKKKVQTLHKTHILTYHIHTIIKPHL